MKEQLILYAVKSKDGKWFRAKGFGGYGDSWVDSLDNAKLYTKIGQARSRVTFWATNFPEYGIPDIVMIKAIATAVLDEDDRVKKILKKKLNEKERQALRDRKQELKEATKRLVEAQQDYDTVHKG